MNKKKNLLERIVDGFPISLYDLYIFVSKFDLKWNNIEKI